MIGVWVIAFALVWTWLRSDRAAPLHDPAAESRAVTPRGDLAADEKATIEVFKESSPSVVYITAADIARDYFTLNLFEIPRGAGTGFIYDRDGHIVTNLHVIAAGRRWTVTLADHSQWEARFVGATEDKDLAVLKIDAPAEQLKPITLGVSHDLQVGQKVFAIGNPFGLDQTLTTGIVSALGREIHSLNDRPIQDVIQTDAAINPGNSGGPLLDSGGRLIGINTQIASPSGGSAGIGFAIPVDTVNLVVPELISHGRIERPMLGVALWPDHLWQRKGTEGVLLRQVPPGSAAGQAGLRGTDYDRFGQMQRIGDLIIKIDDHPTPNTEALQGVLGNYKVGDEVRVTFVRDGREQTTTLRLQAPQP
jgi:S1-C subfamily serine protease